MIRYTVRYNAGPYCGTRRVLAEDADHAIAIVRAQIHREMSLPMYSESYRVMGESDDDSDDLPPGDDDE